jgi:predicted permease
VSLDKGLHLVEQDMAGSKTRANFIGGLVRDLGYWARMLVKNFGVTVLAVLILAFGIGLNSAIFSVIASVLHRPPPFKEPEQLVMVWESADHLGVPKNPVSPANYRDWKRQTTVFQSMAAMVPRSFHLTGAGKPERLDGRRISVGFFDLLGVQTVVGRNFVQEEAHKIGTHVVLLSYGLWQRRFGGDRRAIGQTLTLNQEGYTVIGVMPATVQLPGLANVPDQLWVPIDFPNDEADLRGSHYLEVIARLRPGVTLQQAQTEMDTIAARLAQAYPETNLRVGAVVNPLYEQLVPDIKPAPLLPFGVAGIVLLIACVNGANLTLGRSTIRQREIARQLAVSGNSSGLARQFLTESILLVLFGGALGSLVAFEGIHIVKAFIPSSVSPAAVMSFKAHVIPCTIMVSFITGVIFRLTPAFQFSHFDANGRVNETSRNYHRHNSRNR